MAFLWSSGPPAFAGELSISTNAVPAQSVQTEVFDVPVFLQEHWEMYVGSPNLPEGLYILGPSKITGSRKLQVTFFNPTQSEIPGANVTLRVITF